MLLYRGTDKLEIGGIPCWRFDEATGALSFDSAFQGDGQAGYISLKQITWPHGGSGAVWGHAALFLR